MNEMSDLRSLKRALTILVMGAICLVVLVFRERLAWSLVSNFLICFAGIALFTRGVIDLVRLKYYRILNEAARRSRLDFFPWFLVFPVCFAWWYVVKIEPALDTTHLIENVGEVTLVAFIFPMIIGSLVPWPNVRTIWQRRCEYLYAAGSIICVLILLLGLATQLHKAEMPNCAIEVAPSISRYDHHCDPEYDDDCVPTAALNASVKKSAETATKPVQTSWITRILKKLSEQFGDSIIPYHMSAGIMSIVGSLHLIARLLSGDSGATPDSGGSEIKPVTEMSPLADALSEVTSTVAKIEQLDPTLQADSTLDTSKHRSFPQAPETLAPPEFTADMLGETLPDTTENPCSHHHPEQQANADGMKNRLDPRINSTLADHEQTLVHLQSLLQSAGDLQNKLIPHQAIVRQLLAFAINKTL
jgi:hypothetical protein